MSRAAAPDRRRRRSGGSRRTSRPTTASPSRSRSRSGSAASPVAVTMRTPGTTRSSRSASASRKGSQPRGARLPDDLAANTVEVDAPGFDPRAARRSFYTSSSCGVCGKGALEAVAVEAPRVESELRVPLALVVSLPDRLREAQAAFAATGGLHATGLFSADGRAAVRARGRRPPQRARQGGRLGVREGLLPLARRVLCVSGRLSFELVQKAAVAGCPVLVAVGAPSSPGRRARRRPRDHALRLRPRRAR